MTPPTDEARALLPVKEAAERLRQYLREFDMAYIGPLELIDLLERAAESGMTPGLRLTVEADGSISRIAGGPLEEPIATGGDPSEGENEAANRLRDWMYDPILDDVDKKRAFALLDEALATERRLQSKNGPVA